MAQRRNQQVRLRRGWHQTVSLLRTAEQGYALGTLCGLFGYSRQSYYKRDGGDEFIPKPNTILIDGKPVFTHTPWREDCGCYRRFNPVSGNFWNGMSSSDYSRSGWCPGTATQPVYFDLPPLEEGNHTITIAIPQGEPLGGQRRAD